MGYIRYALLSGHAGLTVVWLTENEVSERPGGAADPADAGDLGRGDVRGHHRQRHSVGGRHVRADKHGAEEHACNHKAIDSAQS